MRKQELIDNIQKNHQEMIDLTNALTDEQFTFSNGGKWSPGQQMGHIYLSLVPFDKVIRSKQYLKDKFGSVDRPLMNYEQVRNSYLDALKNGGKAPAEFVPDEIHVSERFQLSNDLTRILDSIYNQINGYSEEELDTLVIPHVFLGKITLREVCYLLMYHVTHHSKQIELQLQKTL